MQKNIGVKDYQSMQVLSAKPEKLILMLYDGALRFMGHGVKAMREHQIEEAHTNLIKAQNILVELMSSLNLEKGGELAANLFRIYEFMHYTLVQSNISKEPEPVEKIILQLRTLRNSWAEAMKNSWKEAKAEGDKPQRQINGPGGETDGKKSIEIRG